MAIILNDNLKINAGKPVDSKYLTSTGTSYHSIAQVNNTIAISERYTGLTVNISGVEYWYGKGITNSDLVLKSNYGTGEKIEKTYIQTSHGFTVGNVIGYDIGTLLFRKVISSLNEIEPLGIVSKITDSNTFSICFAGYISGISGVTDENSNYLAAGEVYFLSVAALGKLTPDEPINVGEISKPMLLTFTNNDGLVVQYRGGFITSGTTGITRVYGQNIGSGTGLVFDNASGAVSYFRSLKSGTNIDIQTSGSDVIITQTGVTNASNGLSYINNYVILGGALTGNTVINTNNFGIVFGSGSTATGKSSFAGGIDSCAIGEASFAFGTKICALGINSHAEGYSAHTEGVGSHTEGIFTQAIGCGSHAEGCGTIAVGCISHAEGFHTLANGSISHAEGICALATGCISHAEGYGTIAAGWSSHAEGYRNHAFVTGSHAEGIFTSACGIASHTGGYSEFDSTSIFACGKSAFNHSQNTSGATAGFGANANSSVILGGIDHNICSGNTRAAIIGGCSINLTGTSYIDYTIISNLGIWNTPSAGSSDDVLTWNNNTKKIGKVTQASLSGGVSGATNGLTKTINNKIVLGGVLTGNTCVNSAGHGIVFGCGSVATGQHSFANGLNNSATGCSSHAEGCGTKAWGPFTHAEGHGSRATVCGAHSEGLCTHAYGIYSHAAGVESYSIGIAAHAEGSWTYACGNYSHAEGRFSRAIGYASHSEGRCAYACGFAAHVEGYRTIAVGDESHVGGCAPQSLNLFACGKGSFNHSINTTGATPNFGANAFVSAILGGVNHNIDSAATGATVFGGHFINLSGATYANTTAVYNLAIWNPPYSGTTEEILVWNSSSKKVGRILQDKVSDERLKTNLQPITHVVSSIVEGINAYSFQYNDISPYRGICNYGLIAQQVEKVFPLVVKEEYKLGDINYKTIDYKQLVPILFAAIKELNERIEILENK